MIERPILFTGPMVRAILDGRKTMTRRPVKPLANDPDAAMLLGIEGGVATFGHSIPDDPVPLEIRCPYGAPGDRLWVRETFTWSAADELLPGENHRVCPERAGYRAAAVVWRADGDPKHPQWGETLWKPGIHMPRWASRLTLEVTEVRVERVQAITEEDARAEGMETVAPRLPEHEPPIPGRLLRYRFEHLWSAMYDGGSFEWAANPWVWVVSFRRVDTARSAA